MSTDPTSTEPLANEPGTTDRTSTDADERTAAQVIDDARAQLATYPREHLATLPTPLEPCERLSEALGGPEIWIKRDDCTGLAMGGNKVRKLEFLMGQARAAGAARVGTFGALQSNHARQTAAAANALGLGCDLILSEMVPRVDGDYQTNGNQTLFRILGTPVHRVSDDQDTADAISSVEEAAAEAGEIVSWIPTGEGAARSRAAARTLLDALGPMLDREPVPEGTVDILDGYCGDGYGIPTAEATEAIELFARTEGILLDPVYSGKAAAGLIDVVRRGLIGDDERVLFLHTGGAPGLFAYSGEFA